MSGKKFLLTKTPINQDFPREIGTFINDEENKVHAFELLVKNKPGVIFEIGREFAEENISILYFSHSDAKRDEAIVFVVGDFSKANIPPSDILRRLKKRELVMKADYADRIGYVHYSSSMFPLTIDDNRAIIFGPANMRGFIYGLRKNLGNEMALSLLYHIGFGVGEETYLYYFKSKKHAYEDIDETIQFLYSLLLSFGWGRVVEYEVNEELITIDIKDLWECDLQKKENEKIGSHYFRGVLAGFFQMAYNKPVSVKEVKCITKGDEFCRFEIRMIK